MFTVVSPARELLPLCDLLPSPYQLLTLPFRSEANSTVLLLGPYCSIPLPGIDPALEAQHSISSLNLFIFISLMAGAALGTY